MLDAIHVSDLVKRTEVVVAGNPQGAGISVLLPTFNSVRDAELAAVLDSLSSWRDEFCLIAVDDASDDDTVDVLREFAQSHDRTCILRHPARLGLPAVSEFEALCMSRSPWLAFAFHDSTWRPDASNLLRDASDNPAFGAWFFGIEWEADDFVHGLVPEYGDLNYLSSSNIFGNGGALLSRDAIDHVGFYDPHILMSRLCDWDLWQRLLMRVPVGLSRTVVSRERGVNRSNSLGNSYPSIFTGSMAVMSSDRSQKLLPRNFPGRDVIESPEYASPEVVRQIQARLEWHWEQGWKEVLSQR